MKILNEETGRPNVPDTFVIIMNRREAKQLVEITKSAYENNKRKFSFRKWKEKLETCLCCF